MLVKYMTAGVAASALLASVAFAQSPTTTTDRKEMAPAASSTTSVSVHGDWRTSKLIGLNVYNNENESIGSISELLTDKSGNIKAVVLGVGGFLGVGEHLVAVAFDQLKFVDTPVPSTTTSSRAPASGTRPAPTTTTGAASTNTAPASKSNPWYPDHAVFNATKDQLKQMPEFKYST